jgi:hypothetical protein
MPKYNKTQQQDIAFSTEALSLNGISKLYVNGTQVTSFSTSTDPSLNLNGQINNINYDNKNI